MRRYELFWTEHHRKTFTAYDENDAKRQWNEEDPTESDTRMNEELDFIELVDGESVEDFEMD